MLPQYQKIYDWFFQYINDYIIEYGKTKPALSQKTYLRLQSQLKMKIDHTKRVVELCQLHDNNDLMTIIALLHDVGRFEQYARYRTYDDRKSIDHGFLGVQILSSFDVLKDLNSTERNLILQCVYYHNKINVPQRLQKYEQFITLCEADQLDIISQSVECCNSLQSVPFIKAELITLFIEKMPIEYGSITTELEWNLFILNWINRFTVDKFLEIAEKYKKDLLEKLKNADQFNLISMIL